MTECAGDTFALAYRDPAKGQWWFIPTAPAARTWRGPFAMQPGMRAAAQSELGADVTIIETKIRPAYIDRPPRRRRGT
jgi:hypothetical protein